MEKLDRTDLVEFLNTSPITDKSTTYNWAIVGKGITDKSTDYNANVSDEHWIINKNANKDVDSYALSSGVEQTCYKGDEVFDFIDEIKYRLSTGAKAVTQYLEVFKYRVDESTSTPTYDARLWDVAISIESDGGAGGEGVKIKYNVNYKGDPTFGKVTFTKGKPAFTPEVSNASEE